MTREEREFVTAADDLYSAFCNLAGSLAIFYTPWQRQCLLEFARASNAWDKHPHKVELREWIAKQSRIQESESP